MLKGKIIRQLVLGDLEVTILSIRGLEVALKGES